MHRVTIINAEKKHKTIHIDDYHLDNYGHITFFLNYKSLHIVILLHITWSYYNYCNIIYYNNKSENKKLTVFLIKRTSIF